MAGDGDEESGPLAYAGYVARYSRGRGVGTLRSASGREIPFDIRFCELAGVGRGERIREALDEGLPVAFDVGWTSRGLVVTWMRFASESGDSQRQAGAEGEVSAEEATDEYRESGDVE